MVQFFRFVQDLCRRYIPRGTFRVSASFCLASLCCESPTEKQEVYEDCNPEVNADNTAHCRLISFPQKSLRYGLRCLNSA